MDFNMVGLMRTNFDVDSKSPDMPNKHRITWVSTFKKSL